jgi:DDE domain
MRAYPQLRWHLDEVIVKVSGKLFYLWGAVDHEGEVLGQGCGAETSQAHLEEVWPSRKSSLTGFALIPRR